MAEVKAVAGDLADAGLIRITQGSETIADPSLARGPIRLRLPIAALAADSLSG